MSDHVARNYALMVAEAAARLTSTIRESKRWLRHDDDCDGEHTEESPCRCGLSAFLKRENPQ